MRSIVRCLAVVFVTIHSLFAVSSAAYQPSKFDTTRRGWMSTVSAQIGGALLITSSIPVNALAKPTPSAGPSMNPLPEIVEAQSTLEILLSNWRRATIDCTYADVPRELLEQKNKELLLEKASTFALFDKSVSVETCKTTNRIVRDYLGVTAKGPLVGLDKKLKRGLDFLNDVDDLENYMNELEAFAQAYSRATSLSYAAGIADVGAVNNFSKEDAENGIADEDLSSNLNQAKSAIKDAKKSLDAIVILLEKS